jgi:tetratricopeptide (TPR) repeat protein
MKKNDPKTKVPTIEREISERLFERVFLPWTAILILSHLVTMYAAPAYMWGIHFYHFFPAWLGWVLTLATLTILIPGVGEFFFERLEAFAERMRKPFVEWSENRTFFLLSILALPVFWILRSRLHLLGDGYFRIGDLPVGRLHLQEWLDGLIHLMIYRVMGKLIPSWTPELTYSIVSILCGGLFVFLALKLASLLARTDFGKVLIFFSLISLGSMQLFFGYVESYTILQVALLAYVFFAALFLSGRVSILPALLALVISVGLHITSLILLPSFVYLLTKTRISARGEEVQSGSGKALSRQASARKVRDRPRGKGSKTGRTLNAPTVGALILSCVLIGFWIYRVATGLEETGKGIFILPLVATEGYSFGMFSLAHVSEFANQLLLLSPLGISLIVFFLFFKLKFKDFQDRFANFLILAACFGSVYLFVFNFTLGSADWDLRSSPAVFFGLLGVYLFLTWGENWFAGSRKGEAKSKGGRPESTNVSGGRPRKTKRLKAWGLIFIWVGLFHTVPWVLINTHHQRSLNRYLLTQENDPHPVDETGYNLFKVARILELAGFPEEIKHVYQRATQRNPSDTTSYYNLANWYHRQRDFDGAKLILDTLIRLIPAHPGANWMIGNIYLKKKDYAKALPHLEKASLSLAHSTDFLSQLGVAYYSTDQPEKAAACARQMIELRPDYLEAYHLLAGAYVKLGDLENAGKTWMHILTITPDDSIAIKNLKARGTYLEK